VGLASVQVFELGKQASGWAWQACRFLSLASRQVGGLGERAGF